MCKGQPLVPYGIVATAGILSSVAAASLSLMYMCTVTHSSMSTTSCFQWQATSYLSTALHRQCLTGTPPSFFLYMFIHRSGHESKLGGRLVGCMWEPGLGLTELSWARLQHPSIHVWVRTDQETAPSDTCTGWWHRVNGTRSCTCWHTLKQHLKMSRS